MSHYYPPDDCCVYIEAVTRLLNLPALAEAHLSTSETLALFDEHQTREAERAAQFHAPCYVSTRVSEGGNRYIRYVHLVKVDDDSMACYRCGNWTDKKSNCFECPRCHALMLFAPAPKYVPMPPTKARASVGRWTDALFALDYQEKEAFLIETFASEFTHSAPYLGATSEIQNRPEGLHTNLSLMDGLTLLIGENGDTFTIVANKHVCDLLTDPAMKGNR